MCRHTTLSVVCIKGRLLYKQSINQTLNKDKSKEPELKYSMDIIKLWNVA